MAVDVAKFELSSPQDVGGLEDALHKGRFSADQVVAIIGKTEGNGGVNDFSRTLADQTYRRLLLQAGTRTAGEIAAIPMVWSGGCDGVITPHVNIFARYNAPGNPSQSRLTIGGAISEEILPEDIGRPAMVEKIAVAVKVAMADAGITDPKDVHYVQTKTPLLTMDTIAIPQGAARLSPARCRNPPATPTARPRWGWRSAWGKSPCRVPTRFAATWRLFRSRLLFFRRRYFPAPRSCCWATSPVPAARCASAMP